MDIGVLALQGDVKEHIQAVRDLGLNSSKVRSTEDISAVDGLIIPGGESTAISTLLRKWDLFEPLKRAGKQGLPIFGTCAGLILLATDVFENPVETLQLMDISVRRNAYGRQIESFEVGIDLMARAEEKITGVFIRAPLIERVGSEVSVLASYEDRPVLVEQDNFLAASFHPELTDKLGVHRYFAREIVAKNRWDK